MKITKAENRVLEFIDRHLIAIIVAAVTIIGLAVRVSLRDVVNDDIEACLVPWYYYIKINGLYYQVGDYNYTYQFLIWVMNRIGYEPIYMYKILSASFDLVLAIAASLVVRSISAEGEKRGNAAAAYCIVWMSPIVFLNSSAWGQCDAIYASFAMLGLYFLDKNKSSWAFLLLGAAFAFKLQAVFLLPVFLLAYYAKRNFSILNILFIPAMMVALSLPTVIIGKRTVWGIFEVYFNQTNGYSSLALNYPSIWQVLCQPRNRDHYFTMKAAAICLAVVMVAAIILLWLKKKQTLEGGRLYEMAFLLCYTCVMFLPAMHERYGYMYEVLALLLAIRRPKTIPLCVGLIYISLSTYGAFLFAKEIDLTLLTIINIAVYVSYVYMLLIKKEDTPLPAAPAQVKEALQ